MPAKRESGCASVTSWWAYCHPVATAETALWQLLDYIHRIYLSWALFYIHLFCIWSCVDVHELVTGSLGEWCFSALPGGLLSGDFRILKTAVVQLPSAPWHPQAGIILLLEGVCLSLLAMQVCVIYFVTLISQSTAYLFSLNTIWSLLGKSAKGSERIKTDTCKNYFMRQASRQKICLHCCLIKTGGLWETGIWQPNSNLSALGFGVTLRKPPSSSLVSLRSCRWLSRWCLPCAAVRHLDQVEERVLESLAWARDSPMWGEIRANGGQLPTYRQVCSDTHKNASTGSSCQ